VPPSDVAPALNPMSRERFLPHLSSEFRIESDSQTATTGRLVEVTPATVIAGPAATFSSFSLLFVVPGGFAAESKVHVVRHAELGAMELFLSPVGKPGVEAYLEAVITQAA
jgi:hypothetical protein